MKILTKPFWSGSIFKMKTILLIMLAFSLSAVAATTKPIARTPFHDRETAYIKKNKLPSRDKDPRYAVPDEKDRQLNAYISGHPDTPDDFISTAGKSGVKPGMPEELVAIGAISVEPVSESKNSKTVRMLMWEPSGAREDMRVLRVRLVQGVVESVSD